MDASKTCVSSSLPDRHHFRKEAVVKKLCFACVLCVLVSLLAAGAPPVFGAEKVQRFSFSASNPGGTWYTMAGGLVQLLNSKMPESTRFDIVASGGSVENTRRLAMGEADITLTYSSHLWEAKNGKGILEGRPSDNPRVLLEVYGSSHYFVTLKDKNIRSMKDLEGKKVVIGSPGSGSSDNSRRSLSALGIKVSESERAFNDAARALQDGHVDAMGMSGHPASGIVELAASKDIYIIPFSQEELEKIVQITPFFDKGEMPANIYKGQDKPVPCFFFSVYLAADKSMPEDVAYKVMEIALSPEGKEYLTKVHPQFKGMRNNASGVKQIGVPYHPGAAKYWKGNAK
ncbi:MAG: TAXI family TRAP transporter solute-binding subunit [Desulfobacteraceae bacterium]|nr:MAG: TAXI family TRAP transporter solute-binding subunit [Desulfobacteraceae bacterium]